MPALKDISGQRFGKLIAVKRVNCNEEKKGNYWLCQCDCGQQKIIIIRALTRSNEPTRSCGCLQKDMDLSGTNNPNFIHGKSNSREHKIWRYIFDRCLNENNKCFSHYGGRGISITKRWIGKKGFLNFYHDMGSRPSNLHSIDRIDVDKGYSKINCRWATSKEQQRNKRNNIVVSINGLKKCLSEWCELLSLNYYSVHSKYRKFGFNWLENFIKENQ